MKIMAIDFGDARTGIAISDPLEMLTGFTTVVHAYTPEKAAAAVAQVARERGAEVLVVGLPRNMDGTEGPRAALCRAFAALMGETTGLPVELWDERRTTVDAHRILSDNGVRGRKRKNTVDAVAASLILEGYLNRRRSKV